MPAWHRPEIIAELEKMAVRRCASAKRSRGRADQLGRSTSPLARAARMPEARVPSQELNTNRVPVNERSSFVGISAFAIS